MVKYRVVKAWKAWAVLYQDEICRTGTDDGPITLFNSKEDALEFGWKGCMAIPVTITIGHGRKK